MAQYQRKFVAKEIRQEDNKVCYEIWTDHALLCIVWISVKQRATHGTRLLEDWCLRNEEFLKNAGVAGVDLCKEGTRVAASCAQ
jgi:hypothetical protein